MYISMEISLYFYLKQPSGLNPNASNTFDFYQTFYLLPQGQCSCDNYIVSHNALLSPDSKINRILGKDKTFKEMSWFSKFTYPCVTRAP